MFNFLLEKKRGVLLPSIYIPGKWIETPELVFLFSLGRPELVAPSSPECTQCTRPWTEQCRERQELSPCSRSSLKACFVRVFGVSDSSLKHYASLCSEVQRRSVLSSGLFLLSYILSGCKLCPDVYTCQSCRSNCAPTKPAGAFLLRSPSVLPSPTAGWEHKPCSRLLGGRAAASLLPAQKSRPSRGRRRKAKRPGANSLTRGKDWLWQHPPLSPCWSHWSSAMFGVGPWAYPSCCGYITAARASVCHTPGVTVQRKCPSAMGPQHQNWYQSQLGWAHSSSCGSLKGVHLTALWVMNKSQETTASHSSCLTGTPHS